MIAFRTGDNLFPFIVNLSGIYVLFWHGSLIAQAMPVFDDPMPVAIVTLFHHITLIISLAIKIQTMIVAPSGRTTRPSDARASSICFISLPSILRKL